MTAKSTFGNLFLSIGAMKAGTTWLYSVLARHPELHFAMEKEIHYFHHRYVDDAILSEERRLSEARERYLWRFDPKSANIDAIRQNLHWVAAYLDRPVDDFWYRNLFQLRKFQTFACDFSNLNAHLPAEVWPAIASKCDTLRVLFTMRDPVKRLWSHTKFHLQVTGNLDKLDSWSKPEFDAFVRQPHIWNNGEYGAVLRRLSKGLAPEQYKAIFYEDLHEDQRGTLRDIEGFLGIAPFEYPQAVLDRRLTESEKREMPDFFPDLVSDDIARIRTEVEEQGYVLPLSWG
ncbi:MAG: sulfotransferase [Octadecabacter sp.]|nr:sulfotransferase [Octadecabacter sp.]